MLKKYVKIVVLYSNKVRVLVVPSPRTMNYINKNLNPTHQKKFNETQIFTFTDSFR